MFQPVTSNFRQRSKRLSNEGHWSCIQTKEVMLIASDSYRMGSPQKTARLSEKGLCDKKKASEYHSIHWTAYLIDEFLPERRCEICWWSQSRIPWKALRIDAGSSMLKVMFGTCWNLESCFESWKHPDFGWLLVISCPLLGWVDFRF